jgi:hypothetical protein
MLSNKQLENVCLIHEAAYKKCRYLSLDDADHTKYYCLKKNIRKQEIDLEINNTINESISLGKDPKTLNIPLGDNCQGYPVMRYIEQGYDKEKN